MQISWFTPMAYDQNVVMGAIISVGYDDDNEPLWIPFPLPAGTLDFYEALPVERLVELLPDDFPLFMDLEAASLFLMNMYTTVQMRIPIAEFGPALVESHGGIWAHKSSFFLQELPPQTHLN